MSQIYELDNRLSAAVESPFGGVAKLIQKISTSFVVDKYRKKCGIDVSNCFEKLPYIGMYECERTRYKFWRPECIAGDEAFYHEVSNASEGYYRTKRWEYTLARKAIKGSRSVLEIGCGKGYFLRSIESEMPCGVGLELNSEAIEKKVTKLQINRVRIEEFSNHNKGQFEAVCSFQVLEHIVDPYSFLKAATECLAPGGILVISTPNNECQHLQDQEDAFDLPPHHIGHFNKCIYEKIACEMNLEIKVICIASRKFNSEAVTSRTRKSLVFRLVRLASKCMFNITYAITKEPGMYIFVIFRKPA